MSLAKVAMLTYSELMKMNRFQKIALFCICSLIALVFMGAFVRGTEAGMGCPDWPMCWGKLIPPTSVDEVDVHQLVTKPAFLREFKSMEGPDAVLTEEGLKGMFNARHTWTEYINRLFAMPIAFGSLVLLTYAQLKFRREKKHLLWLSRAAVLLVLLNAIAGFLVVKTSLHTGMITTHAALALLLLGVLIYVYWSGADEKKRISYKSHGALCWKVGVFLIATITIEGVMGTEIRALTDGLQKSHSGEPRSAWIAELEGAWVYLIHRSFSWLIVVSAFAFLWVNRKYQTAGLDWKEVVVVLIVLAQMCLGLMLAQYGIFAFAQVLHAGLSSILIAVLYYWLLCAGRKPVS